jgi:hypothetical protein
MKGLRCVCEMQILLYIYYMLFSVRLEVEMIQFFLEVKNGMAAESTLFSERLAKLDCLEIFVESKK